MRNRSLEEKALVARRLEQHVLPLVDDGRIRVPIEATYPFEHAQEGYERFADGGKLGKIVLVAANG
jgi:NADPH:quinone reductase-like Zn-dependent oxidoreductase